MRKKIKYGSSCLSTLFFIMFLSCSYQARTQHPAEVSFTLYPGFTFINFEKALDYSDDYLEEWGQLYFSAALRGFLPSEKSLQAGAELSWQSLYYAYYVMPYGAQTIYREFDISTWGIAATGRYLYENFFAVGGAGIHFFYDGIAPAFFVEAGYSLDVQNNIKIPFSLRINPVFGDGTPVAVSAGVGVSIPIIRRERDPTLRY